MKLKKFFAAVLAGAVALSSFTLSASAAAVSAVPSGTEKVLYQVDLTGKNTASGQWAQLGSGVNVTITDTSIMTKDNVFAKLVVDSFGDFINEEGTATPATEVLGWDVSSWLIGVKWYNNYSDSTDTKKDNISGKNGEFEVNFLPLVSEGTIVSYVPISDFTLDQYNQIGGNLQNGHFSSVTLKSLEIVELTEEKDPKPEEPGDETANVLWEGETDLGTDWKPSVTIAADKFVDLKADDTLKFTFTKGTADYFQLKIVSQTEGWPALSSPETNEYDSVDLTESPYSFVVNAADVAVLKDKGMGIQGYGVTLTKVELIAGGSGDPKPEEPGDETANVLWEGKTDMGTDWKPSETIAADKFADLKADDTLKFTFTKGDAEYFQLKIASQTEGWPALSSPETNEYGSVDLTESPYSFVVNAADVAVLKDKGMGIQGYGVTLTKVELIAGGGETPDKPDEKPDEGKVLSSTATEVAQWKEIGFEVGADKPITKEDLTTYKNLAVTFTVSEVSTTSWHLDQLIKVYSKAYGAGYEYSDDKAANKAVNSAGILKGDSSIKANTPCTVEFPISDILTDLEAKLKSGDKAIDHISAISIMNSYQLEGNNKVTITKVALTGKAAPEEPGNVTTKELTLEVVDASGWGNPDVKRAAQTNVNLTSKELVVGTTTFGNAKNATLTLKDAEVTDIEIDGVDLKDSKNVSFSLFAQWGDKWTWTAGPADGWKMSEVTGVNNSDVLQKFGYQVNINGNVGGINNMDVGTKIKVTIKYSDLEIKGVTGGDNKPGDNTGSGSGSGTVGGITDTTPSTPDKPEETVKVDNGKNDTGATVEAPKGAFDTDVKFNAAPVAEETKDDKFTFELNFTDKDGNKVQPKSAVTVKVPVPAALKNLKTVFVYHIEENGTYTEVSCKIENGMVVFSAKSFSKYVISGKKLDSKGQPAADQPATNDPGTSTTPGSTNEPNANTGAGGVAAVLGVSALAAAALIISKKRK